MKNKITLFTLADLDRSKFNSALHKMCVKSWDKIINYLKLKGYDAEIKIYDDESIEYKKIFNDCVKGKGDIKKSHIADAFRIYILSINPRYMWLDWDIFIQDDFKFNFEECFIMKSFYIIYNHDNTKLFKELYNYYCVIPPLIKLVDSSVATYLESTNFEIDFKSSSSLTHILIHLSFLDNNSSDKFYFITDEDENTSFVQLYKEDKKNYKFINPYAIKHKGIYGLQGNMEIINFIKNNYNLSEEQQNKLNETLNKKENN